MPRFALNLRVYVSVVPMSVVLGVEVDVPPLRGCLQHLKFADRHRSGHRPTPLVRSASSSSPASASRCRRSRHQVEVVIAVGAFEDPEALRARTVALLSSTRGFDPVDVISTGGAATNHEKQTTLASFDFNIPLLAVMPKAAPAHS
jgi:hypothetical protein